MSKQLTEGFNYSASCVGNTKSYNKLISVIINTFRQVPNRTVSPSCSHNVRLTIKFHIYKVCCTDMQYCFTQLNLKLLSRRLRWTGHVDRMKEGRGSFNILAGKRTRKVLSGRPTRR